MWQRSNPPFPWHNLNAQARYYCWLCGSFLALPQIEQVHSQFENRHLPPIDYELDFIIQGMALYVCIVDHTSSWIVDHGEYIRWDVNWQILLRWREKAHVATNIKRFKANSEFHVRMPSCPLGGNTSLVRDPRARFIRHILHFDSEKKYLKAGQE